MATITKALIETLEQHPTIEQVHFDLAGNFHFNVFPAFAIDERTGKRVQAEGLIAGGNAGSIVEILSRKQVLNSKAAKAEKE